jgi:RNA polymerase sigma factor (sigma-70 family)
MRGARTEADRQLERLFRAGTVGGLTDAQLLEQFVVGDDEAAGVAFEAIVGRHGPMVLRVCRSVLRDAHAAEDAFQATFLVLARKARTLGERELLGNWLYGVATRTARKAKAAAARQLDRDHEAACRRSIAVDDRPRDEDRDELGSILHEEIGRLPSSYRAAVVVCYLEGMTQEQAARQLRLAESTVRGRLARARKLLAHRLTRRGVSLSTGLLALGTVADAATVAGAARLTDATIQSLAGSALLFGKSGKATGGAVSATARSLASGVLSTMWLQSVKMIAAALVAITLTAVGTVALTQHMAEAQSQVPASPSTGSAEIATPTPTESAPKKALGVAILELSQAEARASSRPQDPGADRPKSARGKVQRPSLTVAVDPDLARAAPRAIVRAVPVTKDCMILAYLPDQLLGHVDNFGLANNGGGVRALIDWPDILPDEAEAADRQFAIALYSRKTTSGQPAGPIKAHEILEDWREMARWSQMPRYDRTSAMTYEFEPEEGWKLFDITPLVRAQAKAGHKAHGILFRFLNEDFGGADWSGYDLVSHEGAGEWANRHPVLLVLDTSKPKPAETGPKPPRSAAIAPDLVKLVPGPIDRVVPVSKDCMILAYLPDQNLGHVDNFGLADNGGGVRALIDWPDIPPDEANAADRQFLVAFYSRKTTAGPSPGLIKVAEILEDWREMARWSQMPRHDQRSAMNYKFEPEEGWKLFDITPLVRAQAKADRKGHGILLRFLNEDHNGSNWSGYAIVSREGAGEWANRHPVLLVVKSAKPEK